MTILYTSGATAGEVSAGVTPTDLSYPPGNVLRYGADPTGVADSTVAIQAAIDGATKNYGNLALGKEVVIPAGTYACNQYSNGTRILYYNVAYNGDDRPGLKIRGLGQAKITTSLVDSTILYVYGSCNEGLIENIFFENTHAPYAGTAGIGAIQLYGTHTVLGIRNMVIRNCVFEGFKGSIGIHGTLNCIIDGNKFYHPKGRDNGSSTNPVPNVAIGFGSSSSAGLAQNTSIINNHYNGYTGTNGIATDAPASSCAHDGFILGGMDGGIIANNYIQNAAFECINIFQNFQSSFARYFPQRPILITGNILDGQLPDGMTSYDGVTPKDATYAILADNSNLTIANNEMYNMTWGIYLLFGDAPDWVTATAYTVNQLVGVIGTDHKYICKVAGTSTTAPTGQGTGITDGATLVWDYISQDQVNISNNTFSMSQQFEPYTAIQVASQRGRTSNLGITGNTIYRDWDAAATQDRTLIALNRVDGGVVANNTVVCSNFTSDGANKINGISVGTSTDVSVTGNYVKGCDYAGNIGSSQTGIVWEASNEYDTVSGFHEGAIPAGALAYADGSLTRVLPAATTIAALAATPMIGQKGLVNNGTVGVTGAVISGTGAATFAVYYDGTDWRNA